MCVFKAENREVVITISTDTVIRKFLLPWQMRYKSTSTDPLLVQQLVDAQRHADGREMAKNMWTPEYCTTILKSWTLQS